MLEITNKSHGLVWQYYKENDGKISRKFFRLNESAPLYSTYSKAYECSMMYIRETLNKGETITHDDGEE